MSRANAKKAREAARELLTALRIKAPPVPVDRLIKSRGIILQYAPLEEDLSGMAFIKDGIRIIGINALHHPNRQRFTAAHELAHHVLHESHIRHAVHIDKGFRVLHRDDVSSRGEDPYEIEANAFASELLMPTDFLLEALDASGLDLDDEEGIAALARRFRVSVSAMHYRLAYRFQD
jgi:Zn-dependent peptidase ImmA (M78 family)